MDELLDAIVDDENPSQISDRIKDILFAKAAEKVDSFRPNVANTMFAATDDGEE